MDDFIEVQGYPGLVRDQKTNAILNVDMDKIERARIAKKLRLEKRQDETMLMLDCILWNLTYLK